jgi:hypothetical protein
LWALGAIIEIREDKLEADVASDSVSGTGSECSSTLARTQASVWVSVNVGMCQCECRFGRLCLSAQAARQSRWTGHCCDDPAKCFDGWLPGPCQWRFLDSECGLACVIVDLQPWQVRCLCRRCCRMRVAYCVGAWVRGCVGAWVRGCVGTVTCVGTCVRGCEGGYVRAWVRGCVIWFRRWFKLFVLL